MNLSLSELTEPNSKSDVIRLLEQEDGWGEFLKRHPLFHSNGGGEREEEDDWETMLAMRDLFREKDLRRFFFQDGDQDEEYSEFKREENDARNILYMLSGISWQALEVLYTLAMEQKNNKNKNKEQFKFSNNEEYDMFLSSIMMQTAIIRYYIENKKELDSQGRQKQALVNIFRLLGKKMFRFQVGDDGEVKVIINDNNFPYGWVGAKQIVTGFVTNEDDPTSIKTEFTKTNNYLIYEEKRSEDRKRSNGGGKRKRRKIKAVEERGLYPQIGRFFFKIVPMWTSGIERYREELSLKGLDPSVVLERKKSGFNAYKVIFSDFSSKPKVEYVLRIIQSQEGLSAELGRPGKIGNERRNREVKRRIKRRRAV